MTPLVMAAVVGVALVTGLRLGWRHAGLVASLLTLALFPLRLYPVEASPHPGIGGPTPALLAFVPVLVLVVLLARPAHRVRTTRQALVPFAVLLVLAALLLWEGSAEHWAGVVALAGGGLGWAAGASLGARASEDRLTDRVLALTSAGVVTAHLAASVLRSDGLLGGLLSGADTGRARGALAHAGDLGKVLVVLLVLLLPVTRSADVVARRVATWTTTGLFVLLAMTVSRTNIAAALVCVLVWAVVVPGERSLFRRLAPPVGLLVLAAPFATSLVARIRDDPEGGSRPELLTAAYWQISRSPWQGTGPNAYVHVVGQYDPFTAYGLPVHNSFLLAVAELGIPLAALLLASVAFPWLRAAARFRGPGPAALHAAALVAAAPALGLVGWTGWGLLKAQVLPLWCFAVAVLVSRVHALATSRAAAAGARGGRRTADGAGPAGDASRRTDLARRGTSDVMTAVDRASSAPRSRAGSTLLVPSSSPSPTTAPQEGDAL